MTDIADAVSAARSSSVAKAVPAPDRSGSGPPRGIRLPQRPGLEGVRALAVIAVLVYHADPGWLPGGFLGVDVFFVLSGYLITSLLLAELASRGTLDLRAFWLRRARRLLPALYLLLVVWLAFAVRFLPDQVARLRVDALAAFGYVTNWYLVLRHESYFEAVGRPSLFQHLWSLAVEEQFYVLWPTVFVVLAAVLRRPRAALPVLLGGAAASTLLMAVLYQPGQDPSRVYFGTDTRIAGLLVGSALAVALPLGQTSSGRGWAGGLTARLGSQPAGDLLGVVALYALVEMFVGVSELRPGLYRGGFLAVALTSAALIAAVAHPAAGWVPWLLSRRPLRWVGLRSYGIYLWHWPILAVTRPHLDVPLAGPPLLGLQVAATLAAAAVSYRFVEVPVRSGALGRSWRSWRARWRTAGAGGRRRLGLGGAAAAGLVGLCAAPLGLAVAAARPPGPPSYLAVTAIHDPAPAGRARIAGSGQTPSVPSAAVPVASRCPPGRPAGAPRVTAVGDSVMLGAAGALHDQVPGVQVDAAEGRQVSAGLALLQARRAAGELGPLVVVHLGTNGVFTAGAFDQMMGVLACVQKVIFINDKVPRVWEAPNDQVMEDGVRRYPNAALINWRALSLPHPELFYEDGIHLRPAGASFYAGLVAGQVNPRDDPPLGAERA